MLGWALGAQAASPSCPLLKPRGWVGPESRDPGLAPCPQSGPHRVAACPAPGGWSLVHMVRLTQAAGPGKGGRLLTWRRLGVGDVGGGRDHTGCRRQVARGGQRRFTVQRPEFLEDRGHVPPRRALGPDPSGPEPQPGAAGERLGWAVLSGQGLPPPPKQLSLRKKIQRCLSCHK